MNPRLDSSRWKIAVGVVIVAGLGFLLFRHQDSDAQRSVAETRLALRKQGFKTDLADFDFSTPPAERGFELNLMAFSPGRVLPQRVGSAVLMKTAGSNAAVVLWKQQAIVTSYGETPWSQLAEEMDVTGADLDNVSEAATPGRIRFNLQADQGYAMLMPHLASLRALALALGSRAVLELHAKNDGAAWTNLLSATRLITAWKPEPVEVSHLVRFALAATAYDTTWQVLQAEGWPDDRLARLEHEWEDVDFFRGLPGTAAFERASAVAMFEWERGQSSAQAYPLSGILREGIQSPRNAWSKFKDNALRVRYFHRGIFEEEQALLLYYRDRELDLRRAVELPTWSQMCQLSGATNVVPFRSKYRSVALMRLNQRQRMLDFQGRGGSLLARAAEAEARRRLLVTAIALERFRGRHGAYPKSLSELVPELLKQPPADLMDGQPLRYCLTVDGHFILYSLGLDCVDHGGQMPPEPPRGVPYGSGYGSAVRFDSAQQGDLVWPRPASAAEAEVARQAEKDVRQKQFDLRPMRSWTRP